jgi:hypothetical protein
MLLQGFTLAAEKIPLEVVLNEVFYIPAVCNRFPPIPFLQITTSAMGKSYEMEPRNSVP